jgi:hypothetical protein
MFFVGRTIGAIYLTAGLFHVFGGEGCVDTYFIGILLIGVLVSLALERGIIKFIKDKIMGVDFFPCDYCSETICDCGDYIRCDCGRVWCDEKCAKEEGFRTKRKKNTCSFCRVEAAEDSDLFEFLLKKYNLTRDDVLKEYIKNHD